MDVYGLDMPDHAWTCSFMASTVPTERCLGIQERYPGDPQGRAAAQGVSKNLVVTWTMLEVNSAQQITAEVKRINGRDVSSWHFHDILDLLNDKILDNSSDRAQIHPYDRNR